MAKASDTARAAVGKLRIAVDIGGTFTDMAAFDEVTGKLLFGKALSTHGELVKGIQATIDSANIDWRDGHLFLHGSTIAINTLLERNGANTALPMTWPA
jgi:N-methylhydantoinase A